MGVAEAHGAKGMGRGGWWRVAAESGAEEGRATRSQDGHMVRVVGGVICM